MNSVCFGERAIKHQNSKSQRPTAGAFWGARAFSRVKKSIVLVRRMIDTASASQSIIMYQPSDITDTLQDKICYYHNKKKSKNHEHSSYHFSIHFSSNSIAWWEFV
jgi:hypothetical protein